MKRVINLYGACPDVQVRVGDVVLGKNLFVQEGTNFLLILGQAYITSTRIEMKVLDDGSTYVQIQSVDGKRAI